MAAGELTPIDLTLQSFEHSQGLVSAQIDILKYVEEATGTAPSFDTSDETLDRYLQLLGEGSADKDTMPPKGNGKSHVDFAEDKTADFVRGAIGLVADMYAKRADASSSLPWLVHSLVHTEVTKFQRMHWLGGYTDDPEQTRKDAELSVRLRQRLSQGKLSFLYFYGRDENPTKYPILNRMYRDVWTMLSSDDPAMVREHEELDLRFEQAKGKLEELAAESTFDSSSS